MNNNCICEEGKELTYESDIEDFKQYFIDHENYLDDSIVFECK